MVRLAGHADRPPPRQLQPAPQGQIQLDQQLGLQLAHHTAQGGQGQSVTLGWACSQRSACTTTAGRGLPA
ncbi:hypothetical protein [Synechococcus sp. CCY 9618]|uniref:hypothetical protein n=1 Tax=Synechococcus sp. CCY 9618 TaxID=2815602 RepID=UPI001C24A96A|nr:hypothetical protein [Synechococcus sp. CCY 9618]